MKCDLCGEETDDSYFIKSYYGNIFEVCHDCYIKLKRRG